MNNILVHAKRRRGPLLVHTTKMFRGGGYVVSVWEPTSMMSIVGGHSTISSFDEFPKRWWGRVGTRRLPAWIDKIRAKGRELDERIRLVHRHYAQQEQIAKHAVRISGVTAMLPGEWDGAEFRYDGDNGACTDCGRGKEAL